MKTLLFTVLFLSLTTLAGINLDHRPPEIQEKVENAHQKLKDESTASRWREAGKWPTYNLMLLPDQRVIDVLIKKKREAAPGSTMRIIDFGSGMFAWPINVAKHIITHHPNTGLRIEIYGFTGEKALIDEDLASLERDNSYGEVTLKLLQQSEIESIGQLFEENTIDLIVSRWTLRHLVDPMGALHQLHRILALDGFLIFDSFRLELENGKRTIKDILYNSRLKMLSLDEFYGSSGNNYLIQKSSLEKEIFPVKYSDSKKIVELDYGSDNASRMTTLYSGEQLSDLKAYALEESRFDVRMNRKKYIQTSGTYTYQGDPELMKLIVDDKLLGDDATVQIRNASLNQDRTDLPIAIEAQVQSDRLRNFGSAVTKAISSLWRRSDIPFKPAQEFSFTAEEREIEALYLHRNFARNLNSLGYSDVKIETGVDWSVDDISERFLGCTGKGGCSLASYWPEIFRDTLLIPTLEHLRKTKQITAYEILTNGNIRISRDVKR